VPRRSTGDFAELFPVGRPAISRYRRVLREAGLLRERRQVQLRFYSLDPSPLRELDRWLDTIVCSGPLSIAPAPHGAEHAAVSPRT